MDQFVTEHPWIAGLMLKPVLGILLLLFFWGSARVLAIVLWYALPAGRIKNRLFVRVRADGAHVVARPGQRSLESAPIIGWEPRKD